MDELVRQLLIEQQKIQESLATFPTVDYPAYLRRVGEHEGLQRALDLVLSFMKDDEDPDA